MKKNIGLVLITAFFTLFMIEICLRFSGLKPAYYGLEKYMPIIKPASFFIKDDLLGWKSGTGKFEFFFNDSLVSTCNIDIDGNRVIPRSDSLQKSNQNNNQRKKIFLYGCSFTFGQSVSDTSNYPFYLQSMLPDYSICNRGVSGYSLAQMYLSLKQDVEKGNKPAIAIMNYGTFLDERTVLDRNWLNRFKWALKYRLKKKVFDVNYPFAKLADNNSLIIDYLKWKDWSEDWVFRDKSALVNVANTAFNNLVFKMRKKDYIRIIMLCIYDMFDYCNQHGIKVVFYGLDRNSEPVFEGIKSQGAITKLSSVDIHIAEFNCAPFDPQHPNSKAHKIYANEVLNCLVLNNLVNRVE